MTNEELRLTAAEEHVRALEAENAQLRRELEQAWRLANDAAGAIFRLRRAAKDRVDE